MDWIKGLVDCSVGNVWGMLCEQIASDFSRWEELKLATPNRNVQLNRLEPAALMITKASEGHESDFARVGVVGRAIVISRAGSEGKVEDVRLLPSVNRANECRIRHNDKELEIWEISRIFLERFLF